MPERPNIILIMTDQQRGDCLGVAGHPTVETPNLDQLAGEGTYFPHAYSETPSCTPARATLLTGMDAWHTGILGMGGKQGSIPTDYPHTLPGELAAAGYHTQAVGKNHFSPQRALNGYHHCIIDESSRVQDPNFVSDYRKWFNDHRPAGTEYHGHGVDWNSWMGRPSHLPEHLHPTYWTADQGINFIKTRDPEKPFFMKLSFARPHSPYDPPETYYDMYRDRPVPEVAVGDWVDDLLGEHTGDNNVNAWCSQRSKAETERARRCYYGSITFIDHQIGRVLYELKHHDAEAWKNSFIVFLSDHGDMMGDHHLWRKTYAYEGSARIPMIVRPPLGWDVPRGQISEHVAGIQDIMPTLLDGAGVDVPDTCTGQSLTTIAAPQQSTRQDTPRDFLHGEHATAYDQCTVMHYLTDGREKYLYMPYTGQEQLFDLEQDPTESRDLMRDPGQAGRADRWRQRLVDTLEPRGCGTAEKGQLQRRPRDYEPISPHARA